MTGVLRPYTPADRAAVGEVCVRTGAAGGDARGLYDDETLLPDVYAYPYTDLAPQTAFVVVHADSPGDDRLASLPGSLSDAGDDAVLRVHDGILVGYVLAVPDTVAFVDRWRSEWMPGFLARHPQPTPAADGAERADAWLWQAGAHPERMLEPGADILRDYPAHLHIDLLPQAQGHGWGRRLIARALDALAAQGAPGVHLAFDAANTHAGGFYEHLGFTAPPGAASHETLRVRSTHH